MELKDLLEQAASPHLIASAHTANTLLALLQSHISELRLEVNEMELEADLHHNILMKQTGKSIPLKESEYRISEQYKEWKRKAGLLSDVRAVRRNLERHCDLLMQQQRYLPKPDNYGKYERAV